MDWSGGPLFQWETTPTFKYIVDPRLNDLRTCHAYVRVNSGVICYQLLLDRHTQPFQLAGNTNIVVQCTHHPEVRNRIAQLQLALYRTLDSEQ